MRNEIMNVLRGKGYVVREAETVKNGVIKQGFAISEGENIAPTIYWDMLDLSKDIDECVEKVISMYESAKGTLLDVSKLSNKYFQAENIKLCIQRKSDEDIIKEDCLDLEIYARLYLTDEASTKMKEGICVLDNCLEVAKANTFKKLKIVGMGKKLGFPIPEENEQIFVVENAAALAFPEFFENVCSEKRWKGCYIIPSSIYEVIVIPYGTTSRVELNIMVKEVNSTCVEEHEKLSDHAYQYDFGSLEIMY